MSIELTRASQIQDGSCTLFHNSQSLLQKIDVLPQGPEWICELLEVEGDILNKGGDSQIEIVELWCQNSIYCVEELIRNPKFKPYVKYAPYCLYMDSNGTNQYWDEMATGSWWWNVQVRSKGLPISDMLIMNE